MLTIIWIVWTIVLLVYYHKIFTVYYFNLGNGLIKELVVAGLLGFVMAAFTLYYWWITAIIVLLVGFVNMTKTNNKIHMIASVIIVIIVAIAGIDIRMQADKENNHDQSAVSALEEYDSENSTLVSVAADKNTSVQTENSSETLPTEEISQEG